jgi:hypothetical protein
MNFSLRLANIAMSKGVCIKANDRSEQDINAAMLAFEYMLCKNAGILIFRQGKFAHSEGVCAVDYD